MPRRRLFNLAELEFASSRGLLRSDVKGRLPTSLCDPLGSLGNCPMGQTVAAVNSPVAVAVAAALKNGMGCSSPVAADQTVVAAQVVVADSIVVAAKSAVADINVVADQYAIAAMQLFGTLESEQNHHLK